MNSVTKMIKKIGSKEIKALTELPLGSAIMRLFSPTFFPYSSQSFYNTHFYDQRKA